jgi:hypothetical protein
MSGADESKKAALLSPKKCLDVRVIKMKISTIPAHLKAFTKKFIETAKTKSFWHAIGIGTIKALLVNTVILGIGAMAAWSILPQAVQSVFYLFVSADAEERARLEGEFEYFKQTITDEVRYRERIARREKELGGDIIRSLNITLDSGLFDIPSNKVDELNARHRMAVRIPFHNGFIGAPVIALSLKNAKTRPPSHIDQLRYDYCLESSNGPFGFWFTLEKLQQDFILVPGTQVSWTAYYLNPQTPDGPEQMGSLGTAHVRQQCGS